MKIMTYKELEAYKKSYELVKKVYSMTVEYPKTEQYGIVNQVRRAAVSIPSNIAEGYMRGSKEYIQFLKIALGSCAELDTQLSLSNELGFCNKEEYETAAGLLSEVMKLLRYYINRMTDTKRYPLPAKRYPLSANR